MSLWDPIFVGSSVRKIILLEREAYCCWRNLVGLVGLELEIPGKEHGLIPSVKHEREIIAKSMQ
jgi:hypothetical protein